MKGKIALLFLAIIWAVTSLPASAAEFTAFSLKSAEAALSAGGDKAEEAKRLGNITHLSGLIYDANTHDVIIVGESVEGHTAISLDDFVVALHGVFLHSTRPLVSIDPTADTASTGKLRVRFEGGIENTAFGRDALACDVLLKRISLGKAEAGLWGVHSYCALLAADKERSESESHVSTRFWFRSRQPVVGNDGDTYVVFDLPVGVDTEVLGATVGGVTVTNLADFHDRVGDLFAHEMEVNLEDVAVEFPVLRRARQLLALVSLAEGARLLEDPPDLKFWLTEYQPAFVRTATDFDLIQSHNSIGDGNLHLSVSGGFDLSPYIVPLKKGHPSAFREVVLKSRPSASALTWHPPLQGWKVPGLDAAQVSKVENNAATPGFSLDASVSHLPAVPFSSVKNPTSQLPEFLTAGFKPAFRNFSAPSREFANIGGVALVGKMTTSNTVVRSDFSNGGFGLVTDDGQAALAPEQFNKFVTALWAVYYSDTDPGISIDPIGPGIKQHLVRYIGSVVNSDLGRVMRNCDYTMKLWAVGSARPNIPGFMNPDDIAGRSGVAYTGVGSRFWFVPKDLTFRRSGPALLFDHGRMTVQTEFLFNNSQGMKADPANEQWADWFTAHYDEVAVQYPEFSELFDYAKLVALSKYLKESGTPLLWFLMANKDLVLTEDSPGTVQALVKNSDHFEGLRIEGGVQLVSPTHYVMDDTAVQAIRQSQPMQSAVSNFSALANSGSSDAPLPKLIHSGSNNYAVIPEHSLTCGRDSRGGRYQTDFASQVDGQPGLELVRRFDGRDEEDGDFGRGWRLLIPYKVQAEGDDRTNYAGATLPARITLVHLLSGKKDSLVFSADRYAVAGWFPDKTEATDVLGLFPLSDGTFRLEDKLGNRFAFDRTGALTEMAMGPNYHLQIEYASDSMDVLDAGALRIHVGREQVEAAGGLAPRALTLANSNTRERDTYLFSSSNQVLGYSPANPDCRSGFISLLSDGSFRFRDQTGNQFDFDGGGKMTSIHLKAATPLIRAVICGSEQADFHYRINADGHAYVSTVSLRGPHASQELCYQQDDSGQLYAVHSSPSASHDSSHVELTGTTRGL